MAWASGFTFHGTLPGSHVDSGNPTGAALDTWQASLTSDDSMTPRHAWLTPPVIEENGIRLRPWRADDIDAIETRENDPTHWMPARSILNREAFPTWLHNRLERMAEGAAVEWCIADATSDRALGGMVVFSRGGPVDDTAELGYQLFPSARGRGAAKTGARLAIRHAIAPASEGGLGLRRLVAETAADNAASNRVLASNGFITFGREHGVDKLEDGGWGDAMHWELLFDAQGRPSATEAY